MQRRLLQCVLMVMAAILPAAAVEPNPCNPNEAQEIAKKVIQRELDLAPSQGRWMYTASYMKNGELVAARTIQSDDGLLSLVISRNGVQLAPREMADQKKQLESRISDSSFLADNRKAMQNDNARINRLLAEIPDSVKFGCIDRNGSTAIVPFEPMPGSSPFNAERRILGGMRGELRFDMNEQRLLAASGSEQSDVLLYLGLGRVYKGSSISLVRAPVATGIWETTKVSTHIKGKLLFLKTIEQDRDETRTDYVRVPSGLNAQSAIPFLEQPPSPLSAGGQSW